MQNAECRNGIWDEGWGMRDIIFGYPMKKTKQ
jgi:hypothetical protein